MEIGIVVPCYNEEAVLAETSKRLTNLIEELIKDNQISETSKIWFVDDGSKDRTWKIIEELAIANHYITGIKLSRNQGHQNALLAGLSTAEGDALISIDADLQDDILCIKEMVSEWQKGADIVYGVRKKRETDTAFKRITALSFYKIMGLMGVDVVYNHADFRLMSRSAVESLKEYKEVNLFLRGIIPLLGFKTANVFYDRHERFAGESKYPLKKMIAFALNGITSFSVVPLRIITVLGFCVFALSALMSLWVVGVKVFSDEAIPGWASTVLPTYFIGGIQILCIGVIGEYLGRIYNETKERPRYFIGQVFPERRTNDNSSSETPKNKNTLHHLDRRGHSSEFRDL